MFPKAHEPKHLNLPCFESFNGSICTFPTHALEMLVQETPKVTVLAYWMEQQRQQNKHSGLKGHPTYVCHVVVSSH